jgi:quinol monooxygenase YgiN
MKTNLFIVVFTALIMGISCSQQQPAQVAQPAIIKKMIIARVFVKPESTEEFIAAAQVIVENTHKEPGCLSYQLYQDPVQKTDFIFVESYKDQAAIDAHFAAQYFKEFGTKISGLTTGAAEISIIDVCGEK